MSEQVCFACNGLCAVLYEHEGRTRRAKCEACDGEGYTTSCSACGEVVPAGIELCADCEREVNREHEHQHGWGAE